MSTPCNQVRFTVSEEPAPIDSATVAYGSRGRPAQVFAPFDQLGEYAELVHVACEMIQRRATADRARLVVLADAVLYIV